MDTYEHTIFHIRQTLFRSNTYKNGHLAIIYLMKGNNFLPFIKGKHMAQVTPTPTGLTDVSGIVVYDTNIPYCVLDTGLEDPAALPGTQILFGYNVGVTMQYNTVDYPPKSESVTGIYNNLIPDKANTILFEVTAGITFTDYISTTNNVLYPVTISDNLTLHAFPADLDTVPFPLHNLKVVRNPVSGYWFVIGDPRFNSDDMGITLLNKSTRSNCLYSVEGLVWTDLNCSFMSSITDIAFDKDGMGIAIGGTTGGYFSKCYLMQSKVWIPELFDYKFIPGASDTGIHNVNKITCGSSWFAYGIDGIFESTNSIDFTPSSGTEGTILSVEYDNSNNILALSSNKIYKRTSPSNWSNLATANEGITFSKMIYSTSNNTFYVLATNGQYATITNVTTGTLSPFEYVNNTYEIIDIVLNQDPVGTPNSLPIFLFKDGELVSSLDTNTGFIYDLNFSNIGISTLTSITTLHTRDISGITLDPDNNPIGAFSGLSGFRSPGPTGFDIQQGVTAGISGTIVSNGTTGFNSNFSYSNFNFKFKTDIYSPKNFIFTGSTIETGVTANRYEFNIFESSRRCPYNFSTDRFEPGGTGIVFSPFTYVNPNVTTGYSYINPDTFSLMRNMVNSKIYLEQFNRLFPVLEAVKSVVDRTDGVTGTLKGLLPSWYNKVLKQKDIDNFYKTVPDYLRYSVSSYNTNELDNIYDLIGLKILPNVSTFADLLKVLNNTTYFNQYKQVVTIIASNEFDITTDSRFINELANFINTWYIDGEYAHPINSGLNTLYKDFYTRLSQRQANAGYLLNLDPAQTFADATFPDYSSESEFEFNYNGMFLTFKKDNVILQEYICYGQSLNISYNFSSFNKEYNQNQLYFGQPFYIDIISWKNTAQSIIDFNVQNIYRSNLNGSTGFTQYLSNGVDIALVPDTFVSHLDIPGIGVTDERYMIPNDIIYSLPDFFDIYGNLVGVTGAITDYNPCFYVFSLLAPNSRIKARMGYAISNPLIYDTSISYPVVPTYESLISQGSLNFLKRSVTRLVNVLAIDVDAADLFGSSDKYATFKNKQNSDRIFILGFRSNPINAGDGINYVANLYQNIPNKQNPELNYIYPYDITMKAFKVIYKNHVFLQNYDTISYNTSFPNYPKILGREIVLDDMLEDMKGVTSIIDALGGQVTFPISKLLSKIPNGGQPQSITTLQTEMNSIRNVFNALNRITGLNPNIQRDITSLYGSFYDEILQTAGLTAIVGLTGSILAQRNSEYGVAKDFLTKITTDESFMTDNFFDTFFASGLSGATTTYADLTKSDSSYINIMANAYIRGATALFSINKYKEARTNYRSKQLTLNSAQTILSEVTNVFRTSFLPSIISVLKDKFTFSGITGNVYFTPQEDYLFNTFYNDGPTPQTSFTDMQVPSYTPLTDVYVDVNQVYDLVASAYSENIAGFVDEIVADISTKNYNDITALFNEIASGSTGGSSPLMIAMRNLNAQVQVYRNLFNDFSVWRYKYLQLHYLKDDYERYTAIRDEMLADEPPEPTVSDGSVRNFIVNIPPFDMTYWEGITGNAGDNIGDNSVGYVFPRYNQHWKYYQGDVVAFDNYGTTGFSLYVCRTTDRQNTIKGIPPAKNGDLNSALLWKEYHTLNPLTLSADTTLDNELIKNEFTTDELNYILSYTNPNINPSQPFVGYQDDRYTDDYDNTVTYFKGDRAIFNNTVFEFQGSEVIYSGVGLGIAPGYTTNNDVNWFILGTLGQNPNVAPSSGGVWVLDPTYNEPDPGLDFEFQPGVKNTIKNISNPYIVPNDYDSTAVYSYGDKVRYQQKIFTYIANSIYTLRNGSTGYVSGITPPSLDTLASELMWRCCPYIVLSDPGCSGILPYSPGTSYSYGEMVIYKNLPYKFIYKLDNIPLFNSQTEPYMTGDIVQYMGYKFTSLVDNNDKLPNLPSASSSGFQYWKDITAVYRSNKSNPIPPDYNFNHDYCTDFNVLKLPTIVTYDNKVWQWNYNPYNMDYSTRLQKLYLSLSSIKGVPPMLPQPLEPWVYVGIGGEHENYSDNEVYSPGDKVIYRGYTFQYNGSGYGSAVINDVGDDLIVKPLVFNDIVLTGGIDYNSSGNRFLEQLIINGNDRDNYQLVYSLNNGVPTVTETYGIPKWGNGYINDTWGRGSNGFYQDLREELASTLEITMNTWIYNMQLTSGSTGDSLMLSNNTNIIPSSLTNILKPKYKEITSLQSLTRLQTDLAEKYSNSLDKILTEFRHVQFYFYFGVYTYIEKICSVLKSYNTKLNNIDTHWLSLINTTFDNKKLGLYDQLFEFYKFQRLQPTQNGKPQNSTHLQLSPLTCFGKIYIIPGDNAGNMKRFLEEFNNPLRVPQEIKELLFYRYNPVNYPNTSVSYYRLFDGSEFDYNGSGSGMLNTNIWIPFDSDVFEGQDYPQYIHLCELSPVFSSLAEQYKQTEMLIVDTLTDVFTRLGHTDVLFSLKSGSISDLSLIYKGQNISSPQFNGLYNLGALHYCGTDMPIITPFITDKDLDILNFKTVLRSGKVPDLWFTPPDKFDFSPAFNSGNTNLVEICMVDTMPNLYQFYDVKSFLTTISRYSRLYHGFTGMPIPSNYNGMIPITGMDGVTAFQGLDDGITGLNNLLNNIKIDLKNNLYDPQLINQSTPIWTWNSVTKGWVNRGATSTPLITLFENGYMGFQPIGSIQTNNRRDTNNARTDDNTADNLYGFDSPSANRAYLGDEVPSIGNLQSQSRGAPMRYERPNMVLVSENDMFISQGKKSLITDDKYFSFIGLINHAKKVSRVEPTYCTLDTPGKYPNTDDTYAPPYGVSPIRNQLILERKLSSENTKSKFVQTLSVVLITVVSIATAAASFFLGPGALLTTITVIETLVTLLGVACLIGAAVVRDPATKELLDNMLTNPAYKLATLTPTPVFLQYLCTTMAQNLNSLSPNIVGEDSYSGVVTRSTAPRVNYAQYELSKVSAKFIEDKIPEMLNTFSGYALTSYDQTTHSALLEYGFTLEEAFSSMIFGDPGITGYSGTNFFDGITSFQQLSDKIGGVTGVDHDFITAVFGTYAENQYNIAIYENNLIYPRITVNPVIDRPAIIGITGLYFGPKRVINGDAQPVLGYLPNGSYGVTASGENANVLYGQFTIIDPGEGLFELGQGGIPSGVTRFFTELTLTVYTKKKTYQNITFNIPIVATTGYCTIDSQYGLSTFRTSTSGSDYASLPFRLADGSTATGNMIDLIGGTITITPQILQLSSGAAGRVLGAGVSSAKTAAQQLNPALRVLGPLPVSVPTRSIHSASVQAAIRSVGPIRSEGILAQRSRGQTPTLRATNLLQEIQVNNEYKAKRLQKQAQRLAADDLLIQKRAALKDLQARPQRIKGSNVGNLRTNFNGGIPVGDLMIRGNELVLPGGRRTPIGPPGGYVREFMQGRRAIPPPIQPQAMSRLPKASALSGAVNSTVGSFEKLSAMTFASKPGLFPSFAEYMQTLLQSATKKLKVAQYAPLTELNGKGTQATGWGNPTWMDEAFNRLNGFDEKGTFAKKLFSGTLDSDILPKKTRLILGETIAVKGDVPKAPSIPEPPAGLKIKAYIPPVGDVGGESLPLENIKPKTTGSKFWGRVGNAFAVGFTILTIVDAALELQQISQQTQSVQSCTAPQ